ncbi:MAG: hypothetical protein IKS10_04030 [Lachnospiraceae bacterium]|nr:hypothetical protein [Lachnospiraceae bacterium]
MARKKKNQENPEQDLYGWSIEESFESDQDVIAYFRLCLYENDSEKTARYTKVDVRPMYPELLEAFSDWENESDWEENNFVTFRLRKVTEDGVEKRLKFYNGYLGYMLNCTFVNCNAQEREIVENLMRKYYNHMSSDFDIHKGYHADEEEPASSLSFLSAPAGEITREYLEEHWAVSSYNEGTDEQIDYYMNEFSNCPGDKAYMYVHEDDELRELEIVHIVARMDNPDFYDTLIQDDDVLLKGEDEYGADASAEFIGKYSCYLLWFKEVQA